MTAIATPIPEPTNTTATTPDATEPTYPVFDDWTEERALNEYLSRQ